MKVRAAAMADVSGLAELEKMQPQAAGWGANGLEAELAQPYAVVLCAEDASGRITGFVAARAVAQSAEVLNVAVHPQYVRQGIGAALLQALLLRLQAQQVTQVTLEVARDNLPAQALYRKEGFESCAVRKNFYGAGRDGLILRKEL